MATKSSKIATTPERRRLLIIGTSTLLVLCAAWLVFLFWGSIPAAATRPPDSPRDVAAAELQTKVREDSRFALVDVIPDPDSQTGFLVTGSLKTTADESALRTTVASMVGGVDVRFDMVIIR